MHKAGGAIFGSSDEKKPAVEAKKPAAVEAGLAPIGGSAAQGSVIFSPRGDGVTMLVQLNGLAPGSYRVLVHANGNCSSPNGFSAGPPWSPPGATPPLPERIPIITTNSEGAGTLTLRLAGVTIDGPAGVTGRSVVLHDAPQRPVRRAARRAERARRVRRHRTAAHVVLTPRAVAANRLSEMRWDSWPARRS